MKVEKDWTKKESSRAGAYHDDAYPTLDDNSVRREPSSSPRSNHQKTYRRLQLQNHKALSPN